MRGGRCGGDDGRLRVLADGDSGFGGWVRQNRGGFVCVVRARFARYRTGRLQVVLLASVLVGNPVSAVVAGVAVVPVKPAKVSRAQVLWSDVG